MKCAKCRWEAVIGTRCVYHWLKRIAEGRNVYQRSWFRKKREKLEAIILGRYMALSSGAELPLTPQQVVDGLSLRTEPNRIDVLAIIEAADDAARRKHGSAAAVPSDAAGGTGGS